MMPIESEINDNIPEVSPITDEELGTFRKEELLSNGTELVVLERPGAPVHIQASFFSGSRFNPQGQEGISHFLEHMLVAGTTKFPTKDKLASLIEQYGGVFGASTGPEVLNINVAVADPNDLGVCRDTLHEILLEPLLNQDTLETERGAILKELGEKKSNPSKMLWDLYPLLFFQKTEMGKTNLGTEESIKGITRNEIIRFYKENIVSGRLALIASGGVKIGDVKQLSEESLLVPETQKFTTTNQLPVYREKPIIVEKYPNSKQVNLLLGFRTSSQFDSEDAALRVIAEVLGGGRSSTLIKKLRLEKGLVYDLFASEHRYNDSGTWSINTATSKDKLQEVLDIISGEIRRVADNGLTQEEIAFAQRKRTRSLRMQLQSSSSWVKLYSNLRRTNGGFSNIYDYTKGVLDVTPELTKTVAQKYFGGDKWYLAMCGDVNENDVKINL